jgi:hypothetical protein
MPAMADDSPRALDDPEQAAHAWARFRLLLAWMVTAGAAAAAVALVGLAAAYGPLGWVAAAATVGGVVGSVAAAGALMGLAFLSSGTGHDDNLEHRP